MFTTPTLVIYLFLGGGGIVGSCVSWSLKWVKVWQPTRTGHTCVVEFDYELHECVI